MTDKINVAYVVKRYPVFSQTFIVNEILAHEAAGFETTIFALHPPNDGHFQDSISRVRAPVRYLGGASSTKASEFWARLGELGALSPQVWSQLAAVRYEAADDLYRAVLLALEVRKRGISHLHAHFATSATTVARMAALFAGITYSFTAHAKDIFSDEVQPEDFTRKVHDAAAVITVSDYNTTFLNDAYPGAAVHRIYNGLALDRFNFCSPARRSRSIVAVGRFVEKKGFADLIDACAQLRARGVDFECDLIGGGELAGALRMQIETHGLQSMVRMAGELPQQAVIERVQRAAVLAAPCVVAADNDRDGLPTVLTEALALGTPSISTDVTGIPELIRHDETGLLVNQHDPTGLAAALQRLLDDAALRERLAVSGRKLIETNFDAAHNARALREIWAGCTRVGARP
jgi:colanic acid/amylovoran biosynthesis glycosyltransferase